MLGAVDGLTGSFVNVAGRLAGLQDVVAVVAGVLMVLLGLGAAGVSSALKRLEARASARVVRFVRGLLAGGGPGRLYPTGLALGLLPCGLSWTMFLGAAGDGERARGAPPRARVRRSGPSPALLLAGVAGALVGARARGVLYRAGGVLVAVLGGVFVAARAPPARDARSATTACSSSPRARRSPRDVAGKAHVFCCGGCRGVFELVHAEGLGAYYDTRRWDGPGAPVTAAGAVADLSAFREAVRRERRGPTSSSSTSTASAAPPACG